MDAMTLLCNLHADGPATRELLRRAGYDSFEELLELSAEELARTLDSTVRFAQRFLREGASLAERCELSPFEAEERAPIERPERASTRPSPTPPRGPAPATRLGPDSIAGLDEDGCRHLARAGVTTIEELAEVSIRDLSRRGELRYAPLLELQCVARGMLSAHSAVRAPLPAPPPVPTPALVNVRPSPAGQPLEADVLEGLEGSTCLRLASAGITTVEALATAPVLELARRLFIPYPRLLDLQHLARRHRRTVITPSAPPVEVRPKPCGRVVSAARSHPPAFHSGPHRPEPPSGGPFA